MRSFASDNNSGVHSEIIDAIIDANSNHAVGYGDDIYTQKSYELFNKAFGCNVNVFYTFLGTGANVLAMKAMTQSFNSILCAQTAHVNVDECGAVEHFTGARIVPIRSNDGKIYIEDLKNELHGIGSEHHSQPKVISITQPTELGTLYSVEEIRNLCTFAHSNNMLIHIDGARISNALAALNVDIKTMLTDTGVDAVSFGGTKNGMMYGEAVVFLNDKLADNFKYFRKQGMQLASKMRYISAQFISYLCDGLNIKLASHANNMANFLYNEIKDISSIELVQPVQTNGIFARVPNWLIDPLSQEYFFYTWDESENIVRWMTSFDTTEQDVVDFVSSIKKIIAENS